MRTQAVLVISTRKYIHVTRFAIISRRSLVCVCVQVWPLAHSYSRLCVQYWCALSFALRDALYGSSRVGWRLFRWTP